MVRAATCFTYAPLYVIFRRFERISSKTGNPGSREGASEMSVDSTTMHKVWRVLLFLGIVAGLTALYFSFALLIATVSLFFISHVLRMIFYDKDRYIPNLYMRDIRVYDETYQNFIRRTMDELRESRIVGHTVLWEAQRLDRSDSTGPEPLLLDLGVWIGWSTRLIQDASKLKVYGFDTFCGLVEDWKLEDMVVAQGSFSAAEPLAQKMMRDTGVVFEDGVPSKNGRDVEFVKGSTYDTLEPFLAERPDAKVSLFHMDLDTYESCLHALEACKDRFVPGSILVFDEYLVTNCEMRAWYEFQEKYGLKWNYRAWGLETMEMNVEMTVSPFKRFINYLKAIFSFWFYGCGNQVWMFWRSAFRRFWFSAPASDVLWFFAHAGQSKSVSLEITDLGKLADRADGQG